MVECINDDFSNADRRSLNAMRTLGVKFPEKGTIYTVRAILTAWYPDKTDGVRLEELTNPTLHYDDGTSEEPAFGIDRFRELQPPMDITELVEECQQQVVEI